MGERPSPNMAASVRQRLLNPARGGDEEYQLMLSRYFLQSAIRTGGG